MEDLQPTRPGELMPGRLDAPLAMLRDMARAGSLVILLSDFRGLGARGGSHIRSIAMRNDVTACLIHDALEKTAPPPGVYRFGTPAKKVTVDTSSQKAAQVWSEEFESHRKQLKKLTRGLAVRWIEFPTDIQAAKLVNAGFKPAGSAA